MTRVVSLFESQEEATKALDALYASGYESVDTEVIEDVRETDYGGTGVVATSYNVSTGASDMADIPTRLEDINFGDDEEAAWFAQGVRGGGVLVVAEVDEDDAGAVKQFFYEQGGRTYEKA